MYGADAGWRTHRSNRRDETSVDAWLTPLDCRINPKREICVFVLNCVLVVCGIIALSIGLISLYSEPWKLMPPWIRAFVVWTMSLELLVGAVVAVSAGILYLSLGKIAVIHSLSVISLGSDALLSFAYTIICVWGFFAMNWLYQHDCFHILIPPYNSGSSDPPSCLASKYLRIYITLTWIASTSYTISRLPTLFGAIAFATYKLKSKIQHTPIVQFYTEYNRGDDFYTQVISLEECSELIEHMDNPLK